MIALNNEFESQLKWPPENNVSTLSLLSINVQVKTNINFKENRSPFDLRLLKAIIFIWHLL